MPNTPLAVPQISHMHHGLSRVRSIGWTLFFIGSVAARLASAKTLTPFVRKAQLQRRGLALLIRTGTGLRP
jgi:hypothetical protein